ncbi:VWA domain-containing protein [Sulfidibacter corallicola]|uniref:VWA domain-containing protein n=1 Tax=Sulfidibacter corallicola TaxID=2818388 RepID=A0A8A4TVQ5_SULCO|nr:vWA domain-containing protein [Sulfidibacter corallicola]QTD53062.1 VWA domain-containing protein [Sulfidibacter corallicola]
MRITPAMKTLSLSILMWGAAALATSPKVAHTENAPNAAHIQIALLLDTSGSMNGLIDQARSHLWKIVNTMARAKRHGQAPYLEVALFEYGNSGLSANDGYIRRIQPLTVDLDAISESLFALSTNGGDEYCGQVIQQALQLKWSPRTDIYKAIFIAGNEPFNQGSVDFRQVCKSSISKSIVVNTIFCGNEGEGIQTFWKEGADLADGSYTTINQNQRVAQISAPQDKKILELGRKLNETYVAYGRTGAAARTRQKREDSNAARISEEVAVERTVTKASAVYKPSKWDLVDADSAGEVSAAELDAEELPEPMRDMSADERKTYLKDKAEERKKLQAQINELQQERGEYLQKQRKSQTNTLDAAMLEAIRTQMQRKGFRFQ